jgi:hypothetical protein
MDDPRRPSPRYGEVTYRTARPRQLRIHLQRLRQQAVSVSDQGNTVDQATTGALAKLSTVLDRTFGKVTDSKGL